MGSQSGAAATHALLWFIVGESNTLNFSQAIDCSLCDFCKMSLSILKTVNETSYYFIYIITLMCVIKREKAGYSLNYNFWLGDIKQIIFPYTKK